MTTYEALRREAEAQLDAVRHDPAARIALREAFYRKYGFGRVETYGDGTSEIAFLRWMVERGVLDPLDGARPGSPWWTAVDDTFIVLSQLGGLVHEAGLALDAVPDERVRFWVEYITAPSGTSWYRAHNASIVQGYLEHRELARAEHVGEQLFMNEVLYRLLYAEGLVSGVELGELGELLSDPAGPAVALVTHLESVYPRHYQLTPVDVMHVRHLGFGLEEDLARILDEGLILPHLDALYTLIEGVIDQPELARFIKDGQPIYPDPAVEPAPAPGPSPEPSGTKKKIAILGGGMAGLTAAWELTRSEGWQDEYEVTIHQLGWRVGGKTATGRGPHERIEEHGIHILQGWYDNTFSLIDDVYRERRERGLDPRSPFPEWQQAFERNDSTIITEWVPELGRWAHWPLIFPPNDATPGNGAPLSTWQVIRKLVGVLLELALGSPYARGQNPISKWILDHFFPTGDHEPTKPAGGFRGWLEGFAEKLEHEAEEALRPLLLKHAQVLLDAIETPEDAGHAGALDDVLRLLERVVAWLEDELSSLADFDFLVHRDLVLLELGLVNLRGILADVWDPAVGRFVFSRIDHLDYRAWLKSHGASERVLRSGVVRFFYVGTFSNLAGGDRTGGVVAAGTALRFVLRSVGYKGSFVWQMKAGTGDTVVMPLYEVLRARGVKFSFFSEVKDLEVDAHGVSAINIAEQVTLRVKEYEPTYYVGDVRAWPNQPRYEQIVPDQAAALRDGHVDLESPWADWTPKGARTLARGVDFDEVILAIPVAALPGCCPSILAQNPRWQAMVANVATTATMSAQLWLDPSLREMGFSPPDWGLREKYNAANVVTYADPMYSWLDSSLVLWAERWPDDATPKLAAYFTGAMSDPPVTPPFTDHGYPERAYLQLRAQMDQWLSDHMAYFWPKGATAEWPQGLDYRFLTSGDKNASASERFQAQFFRANIDPWQRYTLSAPKTATYRLRTDDSGYANLFLAGDWIDFGMNVGYIEGALTSGAQAARALRKRIELPEIPSTFTDLDPSEA